MGVQYSSLTNLKDNAYLARFASEESLPIDEPFWTEFLSFDHQSPFTSAYSKALDEIVAIHLQRLESTNPKTNRYGILIELFIRSAAELRENFSDKQLLPRTYNALYMLRSLTKYFIEIDSEQNLHPYFLPQEYAAERSSPMTSFVDALFRTTIAIPVNPSTYALHLEVLNTLLALLSIQMCAKETVLISSIYSIFMHRLDPTLTSEFTRILLEHFIKQVECPPVLIKNAAEKSNNDNGALYKIGQSVASSFWSVVTLGMSAPSSEEAQPATNAIGEFQDRLLANQSIHLLLILSNHFTHDLHRNPYRLALLHFTDTQDSPTNLPDSEPLPWFSVDYRRLCEILCRTAHTDQSTLLLYMLLHRNQHFKAYVISRTNIEEIVLPVLRVIYTAPEQNSHHIYMSLIILLILSEDDYFNRTIHQIKLKKPSWYNERTINDISLGGLLIGIVLRTIQYNMARMRDKYLHTNCLAALANMSAQFENLHTSVTQRMISLFNLLSRKHMRIVETIEQSSAKSATTVASNDEEVNETLQDLTIIEDVIRMVLEILNSCLIHRLKENINLIYALLYNREIFENYRTYRSFQDLLQNLDLVIDFFAEKINQLDQRSAEGVKEMLESNAKQFPIDCLRKYPDLKFKYVEEEQPEDFFVPYIWNLVCNSCNLYWSSDSIHILNQPTIHS